LPLATHHLPLAAQNQAIPPASVTRLKLAEINFVRTHGAKMVNFASEDAASTWGPLEVFMSRWEKSIPSSTNPGPFIYIAGRSGKLRPIPLAS
jgi:hypothetical protein